MNMRLPVMAAAAAAVLPLCACAQSPAPTPDPRQLERALAAIERQERAPAARLQHKVAGADRVASTLTKVAPENLDADVAAALLR